MTKRSAVKRSVAKRGFAGMDENVQREIAAEGGRKAHRIGAAHEFTPEEASQAGQKGGKVVSRDRAHTAEIGRRGGLSVSKDQAHMQAIGRLGGKAPDRFILTQQSFPGLLDDGRDAAE